MSRGDGALTATVLVEALRQLVVRAGGIVVAHGFFSVHWILLANSKTEALGASSCIFGPTVLGISIWVKILDTL